MAHRAPVTVLGELYRFKVCAFFEIQCSYLGHTYTWMNVLLLFALSHLIHWP